MIKMVYILHLSYNLKTGSNYEIGNDKDTSFYTEEYAAGDMRRHLPQDFIYWQVPLIKYYTSEAYFDNLKQHFHLPIASPIEYKTIYKLAMAQYQNYMEESEQYSDFNLGTQNFYLKNHITLSNQKKNTYERLQKFFILEDLVYNQMVVDSIEQCIKDQNEIPFMPTKKQQGQFKGGVKRSNFFKAFKDLNDRVEINTSTNKNDDFVLELNLFSCVLLYTFLSKNNEWHKVLRPLSSNKAKNPQRFLSTWFHQFNRDNKNHITFQVKYFFINNRWIQHF